MNNDPVSGRSRPDQETDFRTDRVAQHRFKHERSPGLEKIESRSFREAGGFVSPDPEIGGDQIRIHKREGTFAIEQIPQSRFPGTIGADEDDEQWLRFDEKLV
jgi:hypothetical protein